MNTVNTLSVVLSDAFPSHVCLIPAKAHVKISQALAAQYSHLSLNHKEAFVFSSVAVLIHTQWYSTTSYYSKDQLTCFQKRAAVVCQGGGFVS